MLHQRKPSHHGPVPEEDATATGNSVVVAIDKDKNSQYAVKWAVDHLLNKLNIPNITLIHVRNKTISHHQSFTITENTNAPNSDERHDAEMNQLFLPYRGFCARKQVRCKEIVLEDSDFVKAILEYVTNNAVDSLVVGASTRNALARKFKIVDIPSGLTKGAPDFCTVYTISKGKVASVRSASRRAPPNESLKQPPTAPTNHEHHDIGRGGGWKGPAPVGNERRSYDRSSEIGKTGGWPLSTARNVPLHLRDNSSPNLDFSLCTPRLSNASCVSDEFPSASSYGQDMMGGGGRSLDFGPDSYELFSDNSDSPRTSLSSQNATGRSLEAEMKRLKLELKQTMDMYSSACKEAITAKQKAKELHQWKIEEARKFEEARLAEEAALAIAEMEKAKCKAAIEAAMAAQRIAELEAQKRMNAELKARQETEEKKKALDKLANSDLRYRKYTIEEIEVATQYFSESLKIGEGGYGPVYKAALDHTPVAIKVLRPDAAQGRKQFQQEVEVLSCIRHPNMVLLLGACPQYGCLVYEYMDNGSLDDRLFRKGNTPSLPWKVRFKIAAEIATALLFLHQTKPEPLVHRDLKPGNILLDRNYVSKISDVGLARLVPPSVADSVTQYHMTSTAGTFCYIDPEYQQSGMLGIKSDIYSLGIMLLQIITAKPPMGLTHHVERAIDRGTFAEMLDPTVPDWPVEEALVFAKLALKCAELRRKDRPDLGSVVLSELNRLANLGSSSCASSICLANSPRSRPDSSQEGTRSHASSTGISL